MKHEKIICDGCGRDLTTTGNSIDYRLVLSNQLIQSCGGAVTDAMIYPPIDKDRHFCGLGCLKKWANL